MGKSKGSQGGRSTKLNQKQIKQLTFWIPLCWMIGGIMVGANIGQSVINENPDHADTLFYWCRIYLPLIGAITWAGGAYALCKIILR